MRFTATEKKLYDAGIIDFLKPVDIQTGQTGISDSS
jgi:hypothetical protein